MTTEASWEQVMQAEDRTRATGPERYLSRRQLAEVMGISTSTVDRMTTSGMPSETWGCRTRRYRLSEATAWAAARTSVTP